MQWSRIEITEYMRTLGTQMTRTAPTTPHHDSLRHPAEQGTDQAKTDSLSRIFGVEMAMLEVLN